MSQNPMAAPDFLQESDPVRLLSQWWKDAGVAEYRDPNAAQVATVDATGLPNVRTVLIKEAEAEGFVFYTNTMSAKGRELGTSPKAALVLYWKSLSRQIRVRGGVVSVSADEADAYFATRPRDAQLGAWASDQSREMPGRGEFERRFDEIERRYKSGAVPRPPYWSGYRLVPAYFEFWQERPFRLHDRLSFERIGNAWRPFQLYP